KRCQQTNCEVKTGARIADLRASDVRRTFRNARGAHGAAHGLRYIFIGFEIGIRAGGTEALNGTHDYPRVEAVDLLPRKTQAVENARAEVFHQNVALFQ